MAGNVGEVSDNDFEREVLQGAGTILVDFWAPWCGPCKSIAPVLEEIANDFTGRLKILKMNVDDNPRTPTNYSVRGIPKLIFFRGGQAVHELTGFMPKDQLVAAVNKVLG